MQKRKYRLFRLISLWVCLPLVFAMGACAKSKNRPAPATSESRQREAKQAKPPSGRTAKVKEADLYRFVGTTLLYLHTYKGLTVIDLKDAKKPKILASLPVYGFPLEMFVAKGVATILVRDAMALVVHKKRRSYRLLRRSELISVEIKNPSKPKILQRFAISGELREGVSRMVGDSLYVVSVENKSEQDWRWRRWRHRYRTAPRRKAEIRVSSFDLRKPSQIKLIQEMALVGAYRPPSHPLRKREWHSMRGVTITGTPNALLIAERRYYSWSRRFFLLFRDYEYYSYTRLHIVDVSNPKGKIRRHSLLTLRGDIEDQFKQTYEYDPATKKAIYFGIFKREESRSRDAGWGRSYRLRRNTLFSIDVTKGASPRTLSQLDFGKPEETVRGSLFDAKRKVVYAITARQRDPLYAISYKDPARLKILSAVDGLSGDMNLFRFIGKRRFLLAVGQDFSAGCTGFEKDTRGTQVAVSIIDVRDLRRVRLVQRKCLRLKRALWSNSAVNRNRDQAHKMIGFFDDGKTQLLTVPVSYYERSQNRYDWWYHRRSAVGLMGWDLRKYDPTKSETQQRVLYNLGTFVHPAGVVRRTIIRELPQPDGVQRTLLNISDSYLSLVNLNQPRKPSNIGGVELSANVRKLFRFGQHRVELVHWGPHSSNSAYNRNVLRIRPWDLDVRGQRPILATIPLGRFRHVMQWKQLLLLFRYPTKPHGKYAYPRYMYNKTELVVYDLREPTKPLRRSAKILDMNAVFLSQSSCSEGEWQTLTFPEPLQHSVNAWLVTSQGLVNARHDFDHSYWRSTRESRYITKLYAFDLRDASDVKVTTQILEGHGSQGQVVSWGKDAYFVVHPWSQKKGWGRSKERRGFRITLMKLSKGVWTSGKALSRKGRLLLTSRHDGSTTFVFRHKGTLRFERGSHLPTIDPAGFALPLQHRLQSIAFHKGHFYVLSNDKSAHLSIIAWSQGRFVVQSRRKLVNQPTSLMCVQGGRLLMQSQGTLLVTDVRVPNQPRLLASRNIRPFHRWTTNTPAHVVFHRGAAWMSGGPYGAIELFSKEAPTSKPTSQPAN